MAVATIGLSISLGLGGHRTSSSSSVSASRCSSTSGRSCSSSILGLGIDYNIFLLTRVREERVKGASTSEAVVTAVGRTGGIITAAAIILASAFAALAGRRVHPHSRDRVLGRNRRRAGRDGRPDLPGPVGAPAAGGPGVEHAGSQACGRERRVGPLGPSPWCRRARRRRCLPRKEPGACALKVEVGRGVVDDLCDLPVRLDQESDPTGGSARAQDTERPGDLLLRVGQQGEGETRTSSRTPSGRGSRRCSRRRPGRPWRGTRASSSRNPFASIVQPGVSAAG